MREMATENGTTISSFSEFEVDESKEQEVVNDSLFKDCESIYNMILMTWLWVTISFNYYLIGLFLKYLPGDIF